MSAHKRVYRFTSSGRSLGRWGYTFQFNSRSGIAVDTAGHVYWITGNYRLGQPRVLKFDSSGTRLAAFGTYGHSRGQLFDPIALTVDKAGRIYVADADGRNPRIVVFDRHGNIFHQWDVGSSTAPELGFPNGLAVDPDGYVYVTDRNHSRPHRLTPPPEQ